MRSNTIAFGLLLSMITIALLGCGGQLSSTNKPQQGKAQWANPNKPQSELPVDKSRSAIQNVNMQQVAQDLGILVPPPSEAQEKANKIEVTSDTDTNPVVVQDSDLDPELAQKAIALKKRIDAERRAQAGYDSALIKEWINTIQSADKKISMTIQYGKNYKREIHLVDESVRLGLALKSLIATKGLVEVPFYDQEFKKLVKIGQFEIGGDILPELDGKIFVDQNGVECTKVLCVLANIFKQEITPQTVLPELSVSSADAAYDVLFTYFYSKYMISLIAPRLGTDVNNDSKTEALYQAKRERLSVFSSDNVRTIAKVFWMLPTRFSRMSSLIHIIAEKHIEGQPLIGQDIQALFLLSSQANAGHFHFTTNQTIDGGTTLYSINGYILIAKDSLGNFKNDRTYPVCKKDSNNQILYKDGQCEKFYRPLTQEELKMFEPNIRERLENESMDTIVHELTHALDRSESANNIAGSLDSELLKNSFFVANETFGYMTYLSYTSSWLSLSGWKYIGSQPVERNIPHVLDGYTAKGSDESILYTFKGNKNWSPAIGTKDVRWSYALVNPMEDLAVHSSDYVLSSEKILKKSPSKYAFMRDYIYSEVDDSGNLVQFKYAKKEFLKPGPGAIQDVTIAMSVKSGNCKQYSFDEQRFVQYGNSNCK